jgi:uncharacterized protein YdhG (YjbR/CyaY superfamily)
METESMSFDNIDEYIRLFSPAVQIRLQKLRNVIRQAAPEATEKISYRMPTFYLNGNLVHFAAFRHHIGLYPGAEGIERFEAKMTDFVHSKGAIQFPLDQEMPWKLISEIVIFRRKQNLKGKIAPKKK